MAEEPSEFLVDTSPTKAVVVSSLIKDATVEACIFDLVDNSIDAADRRCAGGIPADEAADELVGEYDGIEIAVRLDENGVEIRDNCTGMTLAELQDSNIRFGAASDGRFTIGAFGVGLNRALFKLGGRTVLSTDNGREAARLQFEHSRYLSTDNWKLPATARSSSGELGTTITISEPPSEVFTLLSSTEFREELRDALGLRYQIFLERGLSLTLNQKPVRARVVRIRERGPISPMESRFKASDGVIVTLRGGQHSVHRFTSERDYDRNAQRTLTREYGWNVFCNGRLIIASDRTSKTGWTGTWHPEYNGFVGTVAFFSEEARLLPWNTTKTDILETVPCFREALERMEEITTKWRSQWRRMKNYGGEGGEPRSPPESGKGGERDKRRGKDAPDARKGESSGRLAPNRDSTGSDDALLPPNLKGLNVTGKLLSLVNEATSISVPESPHVSVAALRMLAESTCIEFLKCKQMLGDCVRSASENPGNLGNPNGDTGPARRPRFDDLLRFVRTKVDLLFGEHSPYLIKSLDSLIREKREMNEVIHNPFHRLSVQRGIQIRDAVQPVVIAMLEEIADSDS